MPLTEAQAFAIMQNFFAFRCASGPDDLRGAGYTLLDVKDAFDMIMFVKNPPANWEDHLYNSCLFIMSLKKPGQHILFLAKANKGTGGDYDTTSGRAGASRGDGRSLLKVPDVSGASILFTVGLDTINTAEELFQWVRSCLAKKVPIPSIVATTPSSSAAAAGSNSDPDGLC